MQVVGYEYDSATGALLQLINFLGKQKEGYAMILPSFQKLCTSMRVEPQVAFLIARPLLKANLPLAWPDGAAAASSAADGAAAAGDKGEKPPSVGGTGGWCVSASGFRAQVRAVLPESVWESLSMDFYTVFWGLSLQDLEVRLKSLKHDEYFWFTMTCS